MHHLGHGCRRSIRFERQPPRHASCISTPRSTRRLNDVDLKDKVVVVTGGTAGVGYAAAAAFARAGARTVVISRDEDRVRGTVAALGNGGADVHGFTLDVADAAAVERAVEDVETRLGPIDVWVNNAMTTVFGSFVDMTPAEFERVTANTYLGTVWGTQAALKRMLPRDRGTIVQVGSALAHQSIPLQSAYCGAKHAVRGFTNAVRCELKKHKSGVRLTMVQLSAFNTPQFDWARSHLDSNPRPLAPVFHPDLAASAILRAATDPRREYWVGWPATKTIIGSRLLPAVADALAARQAFDGQMSNESSPPRAGNLFEPVPRAAGAEGRFGGETRTSSWQWWLTSHRLATAAALAGAVVLLWAIGAV
jgi:NAD(P)-dependent dehydrogenase (short-subunit alcohol dehydrogenase family)